MQVIATFSVQSMFKDNETDMPMFSDRQFTKKRFDIEIDEELRDLVPIYLKSRKTADDKTPEYGVNPILLKKLRKQLQPVFGADTKVSKMDANDVVDSAITHAVEDKIEEEVASSKDGASKLNIEQPCPDGFHVAHVFTKLVGWEVGDGSEG